MSRSCRTAIKFSPGFDGCTLEDRLVLSQVATPQSAAAAIATAKAAIRSTSNQWLNSAFSTLRNEISDQETVLFSNGMPSKSQLATFRASVRSEIATTVSQLSNQARLLPGSSNRVTPAIRNALLGGGSRGLAGKINAALASPSASQSQGRLNGRINAALARAMSTLNSRLNGYIKSIPTARLSQYLAQQRSVPLTTTNTSSVPQPASTLSSSFTTSMAPASPVSSVSTSSVGMGSLSDTAGSGSGVQSVVSTATGSDTGTSAATSSETRDGAGSTVSYPSLLNVTGTPYDPNNPIHPK